MSVALLLAEPGKDFQLNDETVRPGTIGFLVFVALCAAVFLLVRSMNKQMGRIQAPREADLKQQEWERAQAAAGSDEAPETPGNGESDRADPPGETEKAETAPAAENSRKD